jgi:biopolymer transport protein ExbD
MSRLLRRPPEAGQDIDLTPLIDVVFILLIFFMVSTTFVKDSKVDIQRPGAASGSPASAKALRISLDQTGAIFLDNAPVRPWMVQARVREALGEGDVSSVLVIADKRVSAERLIEVVDQARLGGAADVGGVTTAEAGEAGG